MQFYRAGHLDLLFVALLATGHRHFEAVASDNGNKRILDAFDKERIAHIPGIDKTLLEKLRAIVDDVASRDFTITDFV